MVKTNLGKQPTELQVLRVYREAHWRATCPGLRVRSLELALPSQDTVPQGSLSFFICKTSWDSSGDQERCLPRPKTPYKAQSGCRARLLAVWCEQKWWEVVVQSPAQRLAFWAESDAGGSLEEAGT